MTSRTVVGILSKEGQAGPFGPSEVERDRLRQILSAIGRGQLQPRRLALRDRRDRRGAPLLRGGQPPDDLAGLRMAGPVGPERVDERLPRERLPLASEVEKRLFP